MTVKWKITFRCKSCGDVFKKVMAKQDSTPRKCPSCGESFGVKNGMKDIISSGQPPSAGGSLIVKAVDETAAIVMEDYKMTDLKDNVRAGESVAPKLAPNLQKQADSFFSPKGNRSIPFNQAALARKAMSGAYKPNGADPVMAIQSPRVKPPVRIINQGN